MVVAQEKIRYNETAHKLPESRRVIKRRVRKTDVSRRAKILAVSLVVLGFFAGITVAAQYARLAVKNYHVSQLKKEIAAEKAENDQLQLQISELKSVSRIESVATNQLGMVKPTKYAYLDCQAEQKVKSPMVGAVSPGQSTAVAQQPQGNPVIRQVAQILSGIFRTEQR